jgi:hypothetical protein
MSCDFIKFYAELNYRVTTDDDFYDTFVLQDSDGSGIDITGYTITFSLRAAKSVAALVTGTVTKTSPATGEFSVRIPKTDINNLNVNQVYYHSLEASDGTNEITRLKGTFLIEY